MGRLWRTVRHLSPSQVAHRARLRLLPAAGRGSPPPATRRLPPPDPGLLRPCPNEVVLQTAEEVTAGRFRFLGTEREIDLRTLRPPADVSLLWLYHLEYMDYLLDLHLAGKHGVLRRLVGARLADGSGRPVHPYTDSRRACAWMRLLPSAPSGLDADLRRGAWRWVERVAANLEHDVGGNHLLENGLALTLAGVHFRGPMARRLLGTGRQILFGEGLRQVQADGSHFELSPMYHARVLSVLTEGALALEAAGHAVGAEVWETLARMVAFLEGILDPDGHLPLLGDSARERVVVPEMLAEAVWAALPVRVPNVPAGDRWYADAGIAVLEDRDRGHRLLLDAGPVCPDRLPAHGQADTFSITVHVGGRSFVVDPGVYEYAAGEMRSYCRSTRAHSTVEVGGRDSSEVYSSFRIGRRARVRNARWSAREGLATVSAEHDGYRLLGVRHLRLVSHLARGLWLVADRLSGAGPSFGSRLHLHPDCVVERAGAGAYRVHRADRSLGVVPFGSVDAATEEGWYCPEFGRRRRSQTLTVRGGGSPAISGFVLAADDAGPVSVRLEGRTVTVDASGRNFVRKVP